MLYLDLNKTKYNWIFCLTGKNVLCVFSSNAEYIKPSLISANCLYRKVKNHLMLLPNNRFTVGRWGWMLTPYIFAWLLFTWALIVQLFHTLMYCTFNMDIFLVAGLPLLFSSLSSFAAVQDECRSQTMGYIRIIFILLVPLISLCSTCQREKV